ncbi:DNA recombination protein RmuC [bacterium]|nr:DNA recombination protein RmuC [bacterium]
MEWIVIIAAFCIGFILGLAAAYGYRLLHRRVEAGLAAQAEEQRKAERETLLEYLKASFNALSLEALGKSTGEFLKLAQERLQTERHETSKELESKKTLIDQQLKSMTEKLEDVNRLVKEYEKDRAEKFGQIAGQIRTTQEQTGNLIRVASALREALASTKARGQWGERMADDVLRAAGFVEGVNYRTQKALEGSGAIPDFTFLLPNGFILNMDVKFPLDNYVKYLECGEEAGKERLRDQFLKDVRMHVKEVATRAYIDPERHTLDYALLFIPNEQIYAFIHENDSALLDHALAKRVLLCSPITLFAVLAVIRAAVERFTLEQTSNEVLSLLGAFNKQWGEFVRKMDVVGRRIEAAHSEFEDLESTRRRQLERPLGKIEELRSRRGIPVAEIDAQNDEQGA